MSNANNIPPELIEVPLSNGEVAIVDRSDYEIVKDHNWHSVIFGANKYAIANVKKKREVDNNKNAQVNNEPSHRHGHRPQESQWIR